MFSAFQSQKCFLVVIGVGILVAVPRSTCAQVIGGNSEAGHIFGTSVGWSGESSEWQIRGTSGFVAQVRQFYLGGNRKILSEVVYSHGSGNIAFTQEHSFTLQPGERREWSLSTGSEGVTVNQPGNYNWVAVLNREWDQQWADKTVIETIDWDEQTVTIADHEGDPSDNDLGVP